MSRRIAGEIKKTKSKAIPHSLLFFDTEAPLINHSDKDGKFVFKLGIAIYCEIKGENKIVRRKVHKFDNEESFIDIMLSYCRNKSTLYVFAHNVGFDVRVLDLPSRLNIRGIHSDVPIINELAFMWKVKTGNGNIQFIDTSNLGVRSVASLGNDLNFPKLEIDFNTDDLNSLYEYCLRDVEIIEKFVLDYIAYLRENDLGGFSLTLASQSMNAFRHRFMSIAPYIHDNKETIALERDAYFGGRVECYHIGILPENDYYYVDVNSMYPYVMSTVKIPIRLRQYYVNPPLDSLLKIKDFVYFIADCTITTDIEAYGLRHKGKLVFPIGEFRTVLHHTEFINALNAGHIIKVHRLATYSKHIAFKEYVDFFYDAKKRHTLEGNLSYRTIDKLFMNSLYGKFGQIKPHRDKIGEYDSKDVWRITGIIRETGEHYQEIGWYGKIYREMKSGETSLSYPAIAGCITSEARLILWNYILLAGKSNTFYCDTDSLIVNKVGYDNLVSKLSNTELGLLKLEDSNSRLEIWGNKDYVFGDSVKIKGIPKNAIKIDNNSWQLLQFQGFRSWLNNGAEGYPEGYIRTKHRIGIYNKGIIGDNGDILPFNFSI